jgi:hypothetical protein
MFKPTIGPDSKTSPSPDQLQPGNPMIDPGAELSQPSSSAKNEADHFDDLITGPDPGLADQITLVALGKDEFFNIFVACFQLSSHMTQLKSLMVSEGNGAARNCSDAVYDCILDIPALHFLLDPQSKWAARAFAIGCFAVPMAITVKAELAMRNAPKQKPKPEPGVQPGQGSMFTDARGVNAGTT